MSKQIPKFKNEDEERDFWSENDSSEYLNWKSAERVLFPNPADLVREGRELRDVQLFMAITDENRLREIAFEQGLIWDKMSEAEQEQFVREYLGGRSPRRRI